MSKVWTLTSNAVSTSLETLRLPQDEQIASNLRQERIFGTFTSGFGALALVLAYVGANGVMAYAA